jgi:hypothetical protein
MVTRALLWRAPRCALPAHTVCTLLRPVAMPPLALYGAAGAAAALLLPAIASAAPEDEPQQVKRWKDRNKPGALLITVRKHSKRGRFGKLSGQVTTEGWENIFMELPSVPAEELEQFREHYGVSRGGIINKRKRFEVEGRLAPKKRSGRNGFSATPEFQTEVKQVNAKHRGASCRVQAAQLQQRCGDTYRDEPVDHPSKGTLLRAKRLAAVRTMQTKVRPKITKKMYGPRVDCAKHIKAEIEAGRDIYNVDNDEKYFTVPQLLKADVYPDENIEEGELKKLMFPVMGHKSHPTKIMVYAQVCKPILNEDYTEPWISADQPGNQWKTDGKVYIARCTDDVQRQRGKKLRDSDGNIVKEQRWNPETNRMNTFEVYEVEAGDWEEQDTSMNGAMYADVHVYRGGFEATREYNTKAGNRGWIEEQEDGAPGHGFNNKAAGVNGMPGKATLTHEEMEKVGRDKYKIRMYKQSAHSPELNRLDLGVWSCLAAAVRRRYREFIDDFESLAACQDALWEVIQDEWRKMDPAKLYSISEHKYDIAKQVIRAGGKPILKECHAGARKRTNDAIKAARKK